ncbi:speckle-type POZ protein B-like [Trichogramma pretiosum]|uniref:speckle-type POZ protein B-like n=1 Tax=Trichogramma pretiosum TaxID=7493 RepID=UPI0006C9CE0F|nr:speckle-type POZ protein B-like [Trichogramma pretiosum]
MASSNIVKCSTRIDKKDCDFTWSIENFTFILEKNKGIIISPKFYAGSDTEKGFYLSIDKYRYSPCGKPSAIDFMQIRLELVNEPTIKDYEFEVSIIKDGKIIETHTNSCKSCISKPNRKVILDDFPEKITKFISSTGALTIRCKVTVSNGSITNFFDYGPVDGSKVPKLKFDSVLLDEKFSDVKLRTACGKEIPAHKVVLATASPVFNAMFSHDMLENKTQSVDMVDITYEAAVQMLRYIYTGTLANHQTSLILNLLSVADKYQLEDLKNKCEHVIGTNLSTENVLEILKVADDHGAKHLKEKAIKFVKSNVNGPLESNNVGDFILSMAQFLHK